MTIYKDLERVKICVQKMNSKLKPEMKKVNIEAYNRVVDFVTSEEESLIQRNILFYKLYLLSYSNFIEKFKATVYEDIPIKELHKFLRKPLGYHISNFCRDLNTMEQQILFNELSFSIGHPLVSDKSVREKETEILLGILNKKNNRERLFGCVWNVDEVEEILMNQITNFLNDYYFIKKT